MSRLARRLPALTSRRRPLPRRLLLRRARARRPPRLSPGARARAGPLRRSCSPRSRRPARRSSRTCGIAGSPRLPVELSAIFASPGEPGAAPTILFLHGKGGNASEWRPDAVRALELGYNVLLPDLRGHGRSGGTFFTLGFLEKEDLALTLDGRARRLRHRPRADRHPLLLGGLLRRARVRGGPRRRARDLARVARSPSRARWRGTTSRARRTFRRRCSTLTTRWAVARAVARVRARARRRRAGPAASTRLDPVAAVARVTAAVLLVHGDDDRLVPPRFTRRLAAALPPRSAVWNVGGRRPLPSRRRARRGRAKQAYARKWEEFFTELPAGRDGLRASRLPSADPPSSPSTARTRRTRRGPCCAAPSRPASRPTRTRAKRSIAASSGRFQPGR